MTAEGASKGRLRLVVGAGQPQEIQENVALNQDGTIERVLHQLINDNTLEDPQGEFAAMLSNDRVVLELSSTGEDGQEIETPLAPNDKWDRVIKGLQEGKDQEIGIAVSHKGGRK